MLRSLAPEGNHLRQDPLPEFEVLRGKHMSQRDIKVTPDRSGYLQERGDMLEIIAEFEPGDARIFGLKVRLSDDNKTAVRVFYDAVTGEYDVEGNVIDNSFHGGPVPHVVGKGPSYILKGQLVQIRVLLNRIMVETFVNGQTCTTILKDKNLANDRLDLLAKGARPTAGSLMSGR
jgi:sucrose-6-phosphate hydrolase SacC (GH32 family)